MTATAAARARPRAASLSLVRLAHLYLSAFVAPSLIFFAATGALQIFRLPDRPDAAPLIAKLARLHKDDVFAPKPARKPLEGAARAHKPEAPKPQPKPATEALKWFFTLTAIGMAITTSLGLWMGIQHVRRKGLVWALVAAGTLAPIVLVVLAA
jgi:hypothetical protein